MPPPTNKTYTISYVTRLQCFIIFAYIKQYLCNNDVNCYDSKPQISIMNVYHTSLWKLY